MMMRQIKYLIAFFMIAFTLGACSSLSHRAGPHAPRAKSSNVVDVKENGEEYEVIIIDPGFTTWFATHAEPVNYHSLSYYESRNQQYVQSWNEKVGLQAYYRNANYPFENRIQYDTSVDYGLELNYKLYNYFRYIESVYGNRYNFPL